MRRRSFIQTIIGATASTSFIGLAAIPAPGDNYQAFLDRIGQKVHEITVREGKPLRHIVIEGRLDSLNLVDYYRLVRLRLEGQVQPHEWFEKVAY